MPRANALERDLGRVVRMVSRVQVDRGAYARDAWPRGLIGVARGAPPAKLPDVVVWPEHEREIVAVVRYAGRHRVPIVPWGAGSGVCGAAVPIHGGIVIDVKRMDRMIACDADDHRATFQCGILGQVLEDTLARRGLTLGHFPSSIQCSTLGGWVAARSAGQFSSRYGKIEDMVLGLRAVSGAGETISTDVERPGDLTQLLVGSEGTLAVLVDAHLRVRPAPEERVLRGYRFADLAAGCEGMRRVMQLGLRPAVMRLYDPIDTLVASGGGGGGWVERLSALAPADLRRRATSWAAGHAATIGRALHMAARHARGCLMVTGFEGPRERTLVEARLGHEALQAAGAHDLGPEPGQHWFANRYKVSYQQSRVFTAGAFVDTMEVATSWGHLLDLYESVRSAIAERAFVMAHLSHAYPEGCSIYFTFVASLQGGERAYDAIWDAATEASLRAHGTLSHHHGIGLLKTRWMAREHGEALRLLGAAKRAFDPAGIMNPGKIFA